MFLFIRQMSSILPKRKISIIVLVLFFSFHGMSQDMGLEKREVPVGFSFVANDSIYSTEFKFDKAITQYQLDTARNTITLKLRDVHKSGRIFLDSGVILFFDLTNEKLKWSKKLDYKTTNILQFEDYLLETNQSQSFSLDFDFGVRWWEATADIYHIHKPSNLGFGYPFIKPGKKPSNVLQAIDLRTGKEKWTRVIHREYGWNEVLELNDSTLAIAAQGIQTVNIHDGSGWAYYATTGTARLDGGTTTAINALGIGIGLLTGFYTVGVSSNIFTGVVSNLLHQDGRLYMTSFEEVACLDAVTGKVIWKNPLYKSKVSAGRIFIENGKLYQINLGKVGVGGSAAKMGQPYIATYDLTTGNLIEFIELPIGEFVIDYRNNYDYLDLLHNRGILRINKKDISLTGQIGVNGKDKAISFFNNNFFLKSENQFQSLEALYPGAFLIQTSDLNLIVVNDNLEFTGRFHLSELYKERFTYNDHKIIVNGSDVWVIDSFHNPVAKIKNLGELVVAENRLLLIQDNRVQKIDLDKLLRNTGQ